MIAIHHKDTPFPVYCPECWWSDKWDPFSYGKDFDFSRPFFKQYKELLDVVPKAGMMHYQVENCEYNSIIALSKNCYLCPGSHYLEDCYYVRKSQNSKDCINSSHIHHSELLAFSVNTKDSYNAHHLINCSNISDSAYLSDCINCQHCFMCAGLYNKSFHIKNKPVTKEAYTQYIKEFRQKTDKELWDEFCSFNVTIPKKYQHQINCESSSGDNIQNCKHAIDAYDGYGIEDSCFIVESVNIRDCMDITMNDEEVELCYELIGGGDKNYRSFFSVFSVCNTDTYYTHFCPYIANSLGCDCIHTRSNYCILNKQYSKDAYEAVFPRIVKHMENTGEWGEFFPIQLCIFPYNTSLAQDYFPITEAEAKAKGYYWHDPQKTKKPSEYHLPSSLEEIDDSIIQKTLACDTCGTNYKIIDQELKLSRKIGVIPSRLCPDCRSKELISWKNPRKLWARTCDSCGIAIQTTYAPDRPERVYCEACYLREIG